jgi:phenylpropionate dioxygenase-like ring-hydroxylating dioxygenase large terminal subunit
VNSAVPAKSTFLPDNWYVAAWSSELDATPALGRKILGEPIVLFRSGDEAVAIEDRCLHRGMPLSAGGRVQNGGIQCPYHGLEFDGSGRCRKIPGQEHIPAAAQLRAYPLVERDGTLWIWPGDPERADPAAIPDYPYHAAAGYAYRKTMLTVRCNWELISDNLLDLTHLGYVHARTIGGDPDAHSGAVMKSETAARSVRVTRQLPASDPPPSYRLCHDFSGKIDRWQEIDWVPGLVRINNGGTDAGTGAYDGRRIGGVQFFGFHGLTPETEDSTHYFFSHARNFRIDDDALTAKLFSTTMITIEEDRVVLELQAERRIETAGRPLINMISDGPAIQARRIVRALSGGSDRP